MPKFNNLTIMNSVVAFAVSSVMVLILVPQARNNSDQNALGIPDIETKSQAAESSIGQFAAIKPNVVNVRLDKSLIKQALPTNKVWSSALYSGQLDGLFTYPLAYKTKNSTLQVGVPVRRANANTVFADLNQFLSVETETGAFQASLLRYNDLSSTMAFSNQLGERQFELTAVQGSPIAFIKPRQSTLYLNLNGFSSSQINTTTWLIQDENYTYVVGTSGSISAQNNLLRINFDTDLSNTNSQAYLHIGFAGSKGEAVNFLTTSIHSAITMVSAQYEMDYPDSKAVTSYNFEYAKGSPKTTLFGLLPHQQIGVDPSSCVYSILTLRGIQCIQKVKEVVQVEYPIVPMATQLPLDNLTNAEKQEITAALLQDSINNNLQVASSYFGGKNIGRLGRMIEISEELDIKDIELQLRAILKTELEDWFSYTPGENGKYFEYDSYGGGLIAQLPEFGLENYNDHHFQYSYFLYGASIVADKDPEFLARYAPIVNQLALDIANYTDTIDMYPRMRVFDFYEGHSWASGYGRFNDGNNQESSSEAIFAWYGLWRWGMASNNLALARLGSYLYSSEINSARYYWLNRSGRTDIFPKEYAHSTAGIVWGGKYDFATFFSSSPTAVIGIQLIPFTPASLYLNEPEYIERDYGYIKNYLRVNNGTLYDKNLMYISINPTYGKQYLDASRITPIDDGSSRANILAWIYYWRSAYGNNNGSQSISRIE